MVTATSENHAALLQWRISCILYTGSMGTAPI